MYTIVQFPKLGHIVVQGALGPESRREPLPVGLRPETACLYADLSGLEGDVPGRRVELYAGGSATDAEVLAACPYLKPSVVADIKDTRATALGLAVKNAGVLAVYDENYRAAVAHLNGLGSAEIMKDGKTATVYLTGFGQKFGMTADYFAQYIINENRRVNPTSYAIEQEYLRLAYTVIPGMQFVESLLNLPAAYREFCGL